MAAPVSLLKGARAFARDAAREAMPPGFLWDVVDFVPTIIEAPLSGRGAWLWGSAVASADFIAGILAPFSTGEKNLGSASDGTLYEVGLDTPYALTPRGNVPIARQNPVMLFDQVIWMDDAGLVEPSVVGPAGAPVVLAGKPKVRLGTIWSTYFVGANEPGHEDTVYWSAPNDVTAAWDANALWRTSGEVTGLAALRNAILVFHANSVERLRGTRPPAGTSGGDIVLEPLFNQVGLTEPKTIAYWQENLIFADEHGVHITDGAVLRNLVQQGQIQSYWRPLYGARVNISAAVFLNYYVISVDLGGGLSDTLVCDLDARQWFRLSNVIAVSMWASGGTTGMERFWGGMIGTTRLGRLGPMFFPESVGKFIQIDANNVWVLPSFETPFYKLSAEGRKRVRFVYLSYGSTAPAIQPIPPYVGDMMSIGYITDPHEKGWSDAGTLPFAEAYSRYRLPIGKFPYGIAFHVEQIGPTSSTRISDLGIDAHPAERSRL